MQRFEMPQGKDHQLGWLGALGFESPHDGAEFLLLTLGDDIQNVVNRGLGRGRGAGGDIGGRQRRGVVEFIQGQLLNGLAKIAGFQRLGEGNQPSIASRSGISRPDSRTMPSISSRPGGSL